MPLWGTGSGSSLAGRPHPSQSPRGELESWWVTDRAPGLGDGIPEPEAAWQEVGWGGGQTASTLGFSSVVSSGSGSELRAGWHLEAQPRCTSPGDQHLSV